MKKYRKLNLRKLSIAKLANMFSLKGGTDPDPRTDNCNPTAMTRTNLVDCCNEFSIKGNHC